MWNSNDHPLMRWVNYAVEHLPQVGDLELATLKIHLVIEDALRFLLAARLDVPENTFTETRLDFSLLCEIALAGAAPHLVGAVRAINAARNHVSHRIDTVPFEQKLATFIMEAGHLIGNTAHWPTDNSARLTAVREALDTVASQIFLFAFAEEEKRTKQPGA